MVLFSKQDWLYEGFLPPMKLLAKVGGSIGIGIIVSLAFLVWVRAASGNLPYPAKSVWDWAFLAGVLVSQNVHQPSALGIGDFLLLVLSVTSFVVLSLIRNGLNRLACIKAKTNPGPKGSLLRKRSREGIVSRCRLSGVAPSARHGHCVARLRLEGANGREKKPWATPV